MRDPIPRPRVLPPLLLLGGTLLLAGCGRRESLRTLERVPLADSVSRDATLMLDGEGLAWIGQPGELAAYDSAGKRRAGFRVALEGAPRLLWSGGGRMLLSTPAASTVAESAGTRVAGTRRSAAPLVRDPRGHWVFSATRGGSVLGLDPATLAPRWGWPDAGSRVSALAVSPLGDRVYVALAGSSAHDVPAAIQLRDAFSGRLLGSWESGLEVVALEAAPNGTLYAAVGDEVVALRTDGAGLKRVWAAGFGGFGRARADALRVSSAGDRVAALARGRELRVLRSADGKVLQESKEAPRDAAWDGSGRLWVLGAREIRIVR